MRAADHRTTNHLEARVAALKERQRAEDERALRDGRLTAREINRKNAALGSEFARTIRLDFRTIGRVR